MMANDSPQDNRSSTWKTKLTVYLVALGAALLSTVVTSEAVAYAGWAHTPVRDPAVMGISMSVFVIVDSVGRTGLTDRTWTDVLIKVPILGGGFAAMEAFWW